VRAARVSAEAAFPSLDVRTSPETPTRTNAPVLSHVVARKLSLTGLNAGLPVPAVHPEPLL
jgi:hypothetical protein